MASDIEVNNCLNVLCFYLDHNREVLPQFLDLAKMDKLTLFFHNIVSLPHLLNNESYLPPEPCGVASGLL